MKNLAIIIIFILTSGPVSYCQATKEDILDEFRKLSERYTAASRLSFDVKYRYSAENAPGIYLDSLDGSFKFDGSKYWYHLDGTESLSNGEFVVAVYKDDNIIYLSKPSVDYVTVNPIALFDSIWATKNIDYSVNVSDRIKTITLVFKDDPKVKKMQYEIDVRSGFVLKMVQIVASDQFYDSASEAKDNLQSYSVVETFFNQYRENSFDPDVFNIGNYLLKQKDEYLAVAPYQSYKVFLGSPGL